MFLGSPNGSFKLEPYLKPAPVHYSGGTLKPMIDSKNREAIEKAVSQDQNLGPGVADLIRGLRQLRNRVADESINLSAEDATADARQAFSAISALARRVSQHGTSRIVHCQ